MKALIAIICSVVALVGAVGRNLLSIQFMKTNVNLLTGNVSIDGQGVRFTRSGLVEEYTTSMDGVRQDFVVMERPPGLGELVLRLAVSGAKVESAAFGAQVVLANSGRKIVYGRLRVTDAKGRQLPARIEVSTAPGSETRNRISEILRVVVNDAEAVYPVRIDPTFSDANWSSMGGIPGADGVVSAAVVDGSGNLYIGGEFNLAGEVIASNIAKWDGSSWSALGSGIAGDFGDIFGRVSALAVSGSDVYAGGWFITAGGIAANSIAKWDGSTWTPLGSGIGGDDFDFSWVSALAVSGNDVYAAGYFTTAGGKVSALIARAYLPALPTLSVAHSGENVTVSWATVDTAGFALEHAGPLAAPADWVPNSAHVTNDGANKSVTLPAADSPQFFRLRRP